MAAAVWLRRAAAGWVRRAAAASLPCLPPGVTLIPPLPPALLSEAESFIVPGLGPAAGPAVGLMAVPKKDRAISTEKRFAAPEVTNGVTNERLKNIGGRLENQVSNATNGTSVDGSICTWANALTKGIPEGCKSLGTGMKAMVLSHGTSMASDVALVNQKYMGRMNSPSVEIAQVATISDYWERQIGEIIVRSMEKVGNDGVIAIAVDGESELNIGENNRVTDAQNSTKAAVEGTLPDSACASSLTNDIFTTKGCKSLAAGLTTMPRSTKSMITTKSWRPFTAGTNTMDLRRGISPNSMCFPMSRGVTPVKRVGRGYHTSHPHLVTFESATNYFQRGPELIARVPDVTHNLYKLVKYNANRPILLTESGKFLSRSLVECVVTLHEKNLGLKHKLDLGTLLVSSLGTFKLPNLETIPLTKKGRSDDLTNVSSVLEETIALAHGNGVLQYLPGDYSDLLSHLRKPATATQFIRQHPAHLPATTYALAFMKLHGLMEALADIDYTAALFLLRQLPYQDATDDWTKTARNNTLLIEWLNYRGRHYDYSNPLHIMQFGRNVLWGHPLERRGIAAGFLPKGSPPYTHEAVNIMFQHEYPELLPNLLHLVLTHFEKFHPDWISGLGFENLFPGVPPYYLQKE